MRVAVDTSVWVQYLRGRDGKVREKMHALLDDDRVTMPVVVRVELLAGAGRRGSARLRRLLDAIPIFYPDRSTWDTVETWAMKASRQGDHLGVGDLLIGALARQHGCCMWSLDGDFRRMAELGFVERFVQ